MEKTREIIDWEILKYNWSFVGIADQESKNYFL